MTPLQDLLEKLRHGELTESDALELKALLEDADVRAMFARESQFDTMLHEVYAEDAAAENAPRRVERSSPRRRPHLRRSPSRNPMWTWAAVAAAVLVAMLFFLNRPESTEPEEPRASGVESPEKTHIERPGPNEPSDSPVDPDPEVPSEPDEPTEQIARQPKEPVEPQEPVIPGPEGQPEPQKDPVVVEQTPDLVDDPKPDPVPTKAVAREAGVIVTVNGNVQLESPDGVLRDGVRGEKITNQDQIRVAADSLVVVDMPDGTTIRILENTAVEMLADTDRETRAGKQLLLQSGRIEADVAEQPDDLPFVVSTSKASIEVLGTILAVESDGATERLEVDEGRVRMTRKENERSIIVRTGEVAEIADGEPLRARPRNILHDPGFEERLRQEKEKSKLTWEYGRPEDCEIVDSPVVDGEAALLIEEGQNLRGANQLIPVYAGATYRVELMVGTRDLSGDGFVAQIRWKTGDGLNNSELIRVDEIARIKNRTDWRRLKATLVAPPNAGSAVLQLQVARGDGAGRAWIDACNMYRIK